jgi:hypothetical protein
LIRRVGSVPIFVLACDRIEVLRQSLASYRQIEPAPIIVIHDNASTYPPMLDYLASLQAEGIEVIRGGPINEDEDLNLVANAVEDWMQTHHASHYIVTDPDVALEPGASDAIDVYARLLEKFPEASVVGPMLRLDDIPNHYPLKMVAAGRQFYQFWQKPPERVRLSLFRTVDVVRCKIDTTFGLYRRGFRFRRYSDGLRVHAPYWAKHLDWYIDPQNMTPDQVYYMNHASKVSHWGGSWLRESLDRNYAL